MFDLLGVLDLQEGSDGRRYAAELAPKFPAEQWTTVASQCVAGTRLRARFLEHEYGVSTYACAGNQHLFVVGELYARGRHRVGPVGAGDALQRCASDLPGLLQATKGNFVLVLVDAARATAVLATSRLAISPFYYALDESSLVFSTSLGTLMGALCRPRGIDPAGVTELALFNYPLGDRTYIKGVQALRPAEVVRVDAHGPRATRWWDVRSLYAVPQRSEGEALELGAELFHHTVNDMACDVSRLRVSFTSGFDSRAILAVLDKPRAEILTYAFGVPGSVNVSIPQRIGADLGIPFDPVYLDREYADHFDEFALRALSLSDCLSTVERANYPFAFERHADFSPVVMTGLFGSELLRTFQNVGHIVSADLVRVHLASDPAALVDELCSSSTDRYLSSDLIRGSVDEVQSDVANILTDRFADLSADQRFYMFLLTEGLRKYFGAETHMERPWAVNRFPFLDEEFVEFAFSAPFAGVHARTLEPTVANRFRSQSFYAHVIRRYRPELLAATTDHGYPPADLLARFGLLRIGSKVLMQRFRRRQAHYREFHTEEWTAALYARRLFRSARRSALFSPAFRQRFQDGSWLTDRMAFARAASFSLWTESLSQAIDWP